VARVLETFSGLQYVAFAKASASVHIMRMHVLYRKERLNRKVGPALYAGFQTFMVSATHASKRNWSKRRDDCRIRDVEIGVRDNASVAQDSIMC
jgi:hypothetical protein